ncbi:MAG: hypothetical protein IH933_02130 [Euryarchaeota archaeon]|nr:hypothetical protein [Euryarchaeota archaeon]
MSDEVYSRGGVASVYDDPIVGLSFYTDDPDEPIAGFGEQTRLPIPDVGESVRISNEHLDNVRSDGETDEGTHNRYRVLDREFEYRSLDYDGFSGEEHRQVVVLVSIGVEPISAE